MAWLLVEHQVSPRAIGLVDIMACNLVSRRESQWGSSRETLQSYSGRKSARRRSTMQRSTSSSCSTSISFSTSSYWDRGPLIRAPLTTIAITPPTWKKIVNRRLTRRTTATRLSITPSWQQRKRVVRNTPRPYSWSRPFTRSLGTRQGIWLLPAEVGSRK